jgi:hypothetical protein
MGKLKHNDPIDFLSVCLKAKNFWRECSLKFFLTD